MNPDRRSMLETRSLDDHIGQSRRDVTGPKLDPANRIAKPGRRDGPRGNSNRSAHQTHDEQSAKWAADEDQFVLQQSKLKANLRVREARAQPIDYLAFNLRYVDSDRDTLNEDDADDEIHVPSALELIEGLDVTQLNTLISDILAFRTLEKRRTNRNYWRALEKIAKAREDKLMDPERREARVLAPVAQDIEQILAPKTYDQLKELEGQIKDKLRSNQNIDRDYWEQLLQSLEVWKSRATLKEITDDIRHHRERRLARRGVSQAAADTAKSQKGGNTGFGATQSSLKTSQPVTSKDHAGADDPIQATNAMYDREVARGVNENEEIFNKEEPVPTASKMSEGAPNYRPRKPRYFNRVQMGYEWNKYNQTHYDHDNPPPKVVQGYKFNIFYPELMDPTRAPTFKIMRENGRRRGESFAAPGEEDTCLIRFIAGPPYEDIAFRIVDREWDQSSKRDGRYRSQFQNGVLELHFQFKKIFYRK